MGDDGIVFPDQTSSTNRPEEHPVEDKVSSLTIALVILAFVLSLALLGCILFWWRRSRQRSSKDQQAEPVNLSMSGTLGSAYGHTRAFHGLESQSLLSSRKSSTVTDQTMERAEEMMMMDGRVSQALDLSWIHSQVSRYIDASMAELGRGAVEEIDRTYGVLLEEGESPENVSFALQPPIANQEEFISRPESSISSFSVEEILANTLPRSKPISIIGGTNGSTNRTNDTTSRPISRIIEGSIWQPDEETPSVQIQPPSPMHKERPQSALVEPPHLPAKKRLGGATSELQMHQASLGVKQPAAARSDSHLAIIPTLPPKMKPFLPPKQMIGRSKEDMERINQLATPVVLNETDQDYDFPATEDSEQEDYDEPCPVLPETEPQNYQEDYDEPHPVLPNCASPERTEDTNNSKIPSFNIQEDYDEPQPILPKSTLRTPQNVDNPDCEPDYDEPALSHRIY